MIGGTMGVGKTTVCRQLKQDLQNSVFLDGDWCWDASPFQVTDETKAIVMDNICYLLNNFLKCTAYDNIIFSSTTGDYNKGIVCKMEQIDVMLDDDLRNVEEIVNVGIPCIVMKDVNNQYCEFNYKQL